MFNSGFISEVRRENSMRRSELAGLLGISVSYLGKLEKGLQEPGRALIQRLASVTKIPVEKWLSGDPASEDEEMPSRMGTHVREMMEMKKRLNHERDVRQRTEERNYELEQANERLLAEIRLREHFVDVICAGSLSKSEKLEKLKMSAAYTAEEGVLCFDDIQRVLRIRRSTLRNWLDIQKREFECRFADGGKITASSPGEAGLCLRCFDCKVFESGECPGHGDEKRPETIIDLLERLRANGVYDGAEQARILENYGQSLSAQQIANIRYRAKNHLPVPDDVFYLDMRKDGSI